MGVFDKFLDIMKLNDDDYDDDEFYDDDDFADDGDFEEKPRRSFFGKKNNKEESFNDFDADEDKDVSAFCFQQGYTNASCCKTRRKHGSMRCKTNFCR